MFKFLVALLMLFSFTTTTSALDTRTGTPHSSVQVLTKDNFLKAIHDPANGLWLLKFFAPWCGHCKRLAPVLEEVAKELSGKLAIGKIDCDQQKELCKEFEIKGFPTLMFSRDGEIQEFPFSRSKDDIKKFALMMNAPAVRLCDTHDDALQLASSTDNGIVFVAYHPSVTGETREEKLQSTHTTQVVAQSARIHQAFSTFCLLSPTADLNKFGLTEAPQEGFVAKVEAGGVPPVIFTGSKELTSNQLLDFVNEKNVPLVAHLGPHNFNKIGRKGKPLVIGAVDGSNDAEISDMKKQLLDYALTAPKASVDKYYYGWIDGKQWNKFLTQFNITSDDLPQVFVLDAPSKSYWHDVSFSSLTDLLAAVDKGTVEKRKAGSVGKTGMLSEMLGRMADTYSAYFPWSLSVIVAVVVLLVLVLLPAPQELRPPYPQDSAPALVPPPAEETSKPEKSTPATDTAAEEQETKKDK